MEDRRYADDLVTGRRPVRILLDVNILVSDVLSRATGRRGTTSQKLVDAMLSGVLGNHEVQLVISIAMLDSFRDVLLRLGGEPVMVEAAAGALLDLTRSGPDALEPFLLVDNSDVPFRLRDREDAAVLATAFAARADILATDNLSDFETKDCQQFATSRVRHSDGRERQLECQFHASPNRHLLVVAHPLDLVTRAAGGESILFPEFRR